MPTPMDAYAWLADYLSGSVEPLSKDAVDLWWQSPETWTVTDDDKKHIATFLFAAGCNPCNSYEELWQNIKDGKLL